MKSVEALEKAGWSPGRTASVVDAVRALQRANYVVPREAAEVLGNVVGLTIQVVRGGDG